MMVTNQDNVVSLEALEEQGDHAADYIEALLDLADLDGDLDLEVKNNRAYVAITGGGEDLEQLAMPQVVNALQELTRLAVQRKTGDYSGLILDVAGSRELRAKQLEEIADHAITAILAGQEEVELEQMSSYERKIVHDYIADRGFHSESRGEGRARRLVVSNPDQLTNA
ncbi:MAG TPA: R3H domain-containing nucleic acid-binding protein [Microbacteriaceae bacterium]|nr:R3H domain-containing nucleic acid-binding protein [Microbacteriaceae bacterium]